MGISKTEINLRRLLAASPLQKNHAKLLHYVATLREQLEQLAEDKPWEGLPRVSKAQVKDYSEKIEGIASKLAAPAVRLTMQGSQQPLSVIYVEESLSKAGGESPIPTSPGLRRRSVPSSNTEDRPHESVETDHSAPVRLAAWAHIDKHRKLQDDLTDEMVGLAQQLKECSLIMSQSIKNAEKIVDSTEKAVEQSLASTGRANVRALEVYSKSFKTTTCFTWLLICVMTCIFIMVVLLIRVT